ncbi:MAG: hypothetical protein IT463_11530 [Planctomycetes bacterium]|nr:hypothetical protein [Planctomycetota bacterium]
MAGIGGIGSSFSSTSLLQFVNGKTAAAGVTQTLNNLKYSYGDILRGAAGDGSIFDVRVSARSAFEFSSNLSFPSAELTGVQFSSAEVAIDVRRFAGNFEQFDVARRAWALLLASEGTISEDELNSNPAFTFNAAIPLKDSIERLNVEADRPFQINGVKFRLDGDRLTVQRGELLGDRGGSEAAARRASVDARLEGLGGAEGELRVKAGELTVGEIADERERLHESFNFVYYDFANDELVGTHDFADYALGSAAIPDAYFFGQSVGWQLAYAGQAPQNVRNEIIMQAGQYFSSLVVEGITNVPAQTREQLFSNMERTLENYGFSTRESEKLLGELELNFDNALAGVLDSLANVPEGADLAGLREGLGIRFNSGIYTVARFV